MPYFSRLTDIVTCNLTSLLAGSGEPQQALEEIIREMNEGLSGAARSVNTATANVARLETEIGEQRQEVANWMQRAQAALKQGDDPQARSALERKHEVEDLIAGLEQQLHAAIATRDHLNTMTNALQARMADAQRRLAELGSPCQEAAPHVPQSMTSSSVPERQSRVDSELEELRKQMGAQ